MKRKISLIGIGTDGNRSLTCEAREQIEKSTVLIGAGRMLRSVADIRNKDAVFYDEYRPGEIMEILEKMSEEEVVSILYSGDPGFYSGAKKMTVCLEKAGWKVQVIPGIASVICMASRCHVPWEQAAFVSLHGMRQNVIHEICNHEHTLILLGDRKETEAFLEKMAWYGLDHLEAAAGRNLSYETEEIFHGKIRDLTAGQLEGLTVLWVHHPDFCSEIHRHLEDEELIRGKVPMTKSAIRAMAVASLKLSRDAVLYDVGAGTGSVSIEAALQDGGIQVFAIEKNPEGIRLIEENKRKWKTDQVTIVEGTAPEALIDLPAPSHVFIGGSGRYLKKIIELCTEKNPSVRIVMTAVSLETMAEMTGILEDSRWETVQVMQIQASHGKRMGNYHMMMAQNPVCLAILQGRKEEENE